jgi:hypothetical protein
MLFYYYISALLNNIKQIIKYLFNTHIIDIISLNQLILIIIIIKN